MCACAVSAQLQLCSMSVNESEESSASDSEASGDKEHKNLPEGAPRISSGALLELEGEEEEELRCSTIRLQNDTQLQSFFFPRLLGTRSAS